MIVPPNDAENADRGQRTEHERVASEIRVEHSANAG